ncbi:MAG: DNA-3-methyladenine glycosylase, partial [Gammaproteobacteria bacterium]
MPKTTAQRNPLPREFYARSPLVVARNLLGKKLVREYEGERLVGIISEVEAYLGERDSASHAFRGRTPRNGVMFGPGGHVYVYLVYGMH